MGLLQNISVLSAEPIRNTGGAAIQCIIRTSYNRPEQYFNQFIGYSSMDRKGGVPYGYSPPYQWCMPIDDGGMSSFRTILAEGKVAINSSLTMGKRFDLTTLTGSGLIVTSPLSLLLHLGITLTGSGEVSITSNLKSMASIASTLIGEGLITEAGLTLLAYIEAQLGAAGEVSASSNLGTALNMASTLVGAGQIEDSLIKLILWCTATLEGQGSLDAAVAARAIISSNITGQGGMEDSLLGLIAWCNTQITALGQVDSSSSLRGQSYLEADITSAGELVTPTSCANAVWSALASAFNVSGTMGNKLNLAASGGVDYQALANAVWNELQSGHTTDGTFGKYLDSAISGINITQSSSGVNASAIDFQLVNGIIESGTYLNVRTVDGIYHKINSDGGGVIDINYTFNIGKNAIPSTASFLADLYGNNDDLGVYAWNYSLSVWEQIGLREGDGNHNPTVKNYNFLQSHVGTGSNVGEVKIRFYGTGLTSANFWIDQLLITYAIVTRSIGYYGSVVSATSNTIVLGNDASSIDNYYKPGLVVIVSGTGADQYGRIDSYEGLTRTITIAGTFELPPDSTSTIQIAPWGSTRVSEIDQSPLNSISSTVWGKELPGSYTGSEAGKVVSDMKDKTDNIPVDPATETTLVSIYTIVNLIKEIECGKWEIVNNQLIIYASDNLTEIVRFNLFDENGAPTSVNVFKRVKV